MIPWNYNIYGTATANYLYYNDEDPIGTLLNETTYGYFYEGNPLYSVNRDVKLEESIYLWHIGAGSSAGTNAAFCLSLGDTLDLQVAYNQPSKVPLAMQLCNVDSRDFYKDPKARLCYDFLEYTWVNYYKSKLFVDINRTKFCVNPRIRCYNTTNNAKTTRTLSDIVSYINGDPEHRFPYLMYLDLYNGYTTPRGTEMSYVPSESVSGNATPDILIDRPIPDNAEAVKLDLQYLPLAEDNPQETWIYNKQYSPFTQAIPQAWYDGVLSLVMPYCIGELLQNTVQQIRTGRKAATYNSNRVTGGFMHISTKVQQFDDVVYQWQMHNIYEEGLVELENGFPLNTLPNNHKITTVSLLHIIDKKDSSSMGEAVQRALKHEIAFYGFYFADNENDARNATLGTANNHIYLPEFVGGVTTGRYFTGDEIPEVPYANATSTSPFAYHEDAPPPTSDTLSMFPTEVMALPRFGHTYKCSFNAIDCLNRHLKSFDWSSANRESLFFGQNPYDFIINITGYPMVYFPAPYRSYENIVLGKLDLNDPQQLPDLDPDDLYAIGNPIMGGHIIYENPFGSLYIPPYYSEQPYNMAFLDYEPYTTMFLLLPYAGMVSIPPAVFMGKTMNIRMSVDLLSGAVVYFISANNTFYCTANGNCGTEVPVSGLDYASYEERYQRTNYMGAAEFLTGVNSVIGNATGATVSASFNNEGGMVGQLAMGFVNTMKTGLTTAYTLIEMSRMAPSPVSVSNGNAPLGTAGLQDAILVVNRPVLPSSEEFSSSSFRKTMGKAANEVGKLGDYSGFTIVKNPILDGISCTAEEKALIIDALSQGVIL